MNRIYRIIWSKAKEKWVVVSEKVKACGARPATTVGSLAAAALLATGGGAYALDPGALPTGGQVIAGQGVISQSGSAMTVTQDTQRMIANWATFNIGQNASVAFKQPGASSVAMNRIQDQNPSQIFGSLTANGTIFLLNPSGVVFGKTAQVDVGGLVASSLNLLDSDFMSGKYNFYKNGLAGSVTNEGQINAIPGGVVALIAPKVINDGDITANSGSVALAAGNKVSLDFAGDGLIKLNIDEAAVDAQVANKGLIKADGGLVVMTAKAAGALTSLVVNNEGIIEANTLSTKNGRIILDGGDSGVSATSGSITVKGEQSGETGGTVTITGNKVGLFENAVIDASGQAGGGTVLVGGDYQGKNADIANAQSTYVAAGAKILADAINSGDGGKVVVWADQFTNYQGHISAKGGATGGDGGFAEVSGKQTLAFNGTVDLTAPLGAVGKLLLDPTNLTITSTDSNNVTGSTPFTPTGSSSTLSVTTLATALDSADVTVTTAGSPDNSQAGDITVASSIGWFSNHKLTLSATGAITINDSVNIQSFDGSLALTAGTGITQNTTTAGRLLIGGTTELTSTSGNISLNSTTNQLIGSVSATADAGNISIKNARALALGNISASGSVTLETVANAGSITSSGTFAAASLYAKAHDTGGISLADVNGNLTVSLLEAGGAMTLGDDSTGALTFTHVSNGSNVIVGNDAAGGQASGIVSIKGSSITINDPVRTKGGNVILTSTSDAITAAADADIVTTADDNTGTSSGSVTVTAANGITLQNIITRGANNNIGVGSNSAQVSLTAMTGDLNVKAITTSGGHAVKFNIGDTSNRNGGNAGNIVLSANGGTGADIFLNGDLNAVGGFYVGDAARGLGGFITLATPVVLTADRLVSSGGTTGNIRFSSTIDSDGTPRNLVVNAGTGSVYLQDTIGGTSALLGLSVASSSNVYLGGLGHAIGITTTATNATVTYNAITPPESADSHVDSISGTTTTGRAVHFDTSGATYLDDAVTFTRGTGAISFSNDLYSKNTERNDLTFNGAGGGAITVGRYVGGTSATDATKLGDILVSSGTDLTLSYFISAKSLIAQNNTGRIYLGSDSYQQWYDGTGGLQIKTTGTANNYSYDQNIHMGSYVTLSNATAPIDVYAPNGSIDFYHSANLTTAGGDIRLNAGAGSLAIGAYSNLASNNGLISLTGVGVTASTTYDSTINAGSGKIRIDGGGSAVTMYNRLISTNADSGGTPAVLITNVAGGNSVTLRSVTAQTGTLQVGLIGSSDTLAPAQALGGSGSLSLVSPAIRFTSTKNITLTSSGDDTAVSFTVNGTDNSGNPLTEVISGGNAGTVTTTNAFRTVTSITSNAATAGTVSVGLAANDAVGASFSQYFPKYSSNDKIDIKTLSAATNNAISITSPNNIIDTLGNFYVGSSLDVRAKGRTAGMALTGDVTATSVTIKTGNGALALGSRNITSTSGNVFLQGLGLTQSSGSTITSAGTTTIYGADYSNGTKGAVTMSGSLVSASTVTFDQANALQLGNVRIGSAGSRGALQLGTNNWYNDGTYAQSSVVAGAITQAADTKLEVGQVSAYQTSGAITLTNTDNEIGTLGSIYRGGALSIYDKDTENNGLTINGYTDAGTNTSNAVIIETKGALNHGGYRIYGQGVTLSGSSITGSGTVRADMGAGGDLVLRANGGNITLTGTYQTSGTNNELIIQGANNVQLGGYTYVGSSSLDLGYLGTSGAIAASQTVSGAGNLTLTSGTVTLTNGQRASITSAGNDTGVTFTVTGTDLFGRTQTETITGANAGTATGTKYFASITQIASSGAASGNVTVNTADEKIAGNVTQAGRIESTPLIRGIVDGSVTLTRTDNSFAAIGNFTAGGDFQAKSQTGTLTISGAVVSTAGNVNIQNPYYHLTVAGTGSVTANAATKGVTLRANADTTGYSNYTASIQGAVVANSGGITLGSNYGSVNTSGLGTLTSTGNITISSGNYYYDSTTGYSTSIGAAVDAGTATITINSAGTFTNTSTGTLTTGGAINITSGNNTNTSSYATTINGAVSAGVGGNNNIAINSSGAFSNNSAGKLTATGSISIKTYWDGTNKRNLTLDGDLTAGVSGIKLTSSGTINQTAGVITTTGTLYGADQSGGTPTNAYPSARGAVTLSQNNQIANLGPFYLLGGGSDGFTVNDVSGGLTLAGTIENSNGNITITTAGGALNLGTYSVYAGGRASGGANVALTGQGIVQGIGSSINTSGGTTDSPRTGTNGGGTITLTGHDGSASGTISLAGTLETQNATASAIKIRGTSDLALPNIVVPNGTLVLGDDTATIGLITGNITQSSSTSIDANTLTIGTATNATGGSAVIANSGNKIVQLGTVKTGNNGAVQYDLDINDSTDGLLLTQNIISAGGIRLVTTTGGGASGALALGTKNVLASGYIFLKGDGVTQSSGATINADNSGGGATGGSIRVDANGGTNNITLSGTVTTDNDTATAIEFVNATNATLNIVSATAGTVSLGVDTKELTGTVSQVETTGTISAATIKGDAGIVTINTSNIDNVGPLTTTGTLTLKEQGGAGTAGLKFVGNVTVGGTTEIQTTDGVLNLDTYKLDATGLGITLRGVGVTQVADSSQIKAATADIYGGTGSIDLFSNQNDFTGQVTVNSTGSQVSVRDTNQLSMNNLSGRLAGATSIKLWGGTQLALTTEDITTTTGNIEFKSLGGILNTPGKLTTGSGNITLYSSTTLSLAEKILSTSGNVDVEAATIASRAGAKDYIQTGASGTIYLRATSGNFTQGSDVLYKTVNGNITIEALNGNATLANIQSTTGALNVTSGGNITQLSGTAITVGAIDATSKKDLGGAITLTESANNASYIRLRSLNAAGDAAAAGAIQYQDANGFAVREILTSSNATLTSHGNITNDTTGYSGTVTADLLTVKTLLDAGAGVDLSQANDVKTLNIKVRNSADTATAGETTTPTGTIRFTDSDDFSITGIETGGSTVLTAGAAVSQTGAILSAKLGLSGAGGYTLNSASSGTPINEVSTFASDATGNVNFTTKLALAIGAVNPTGITTGGGSITIAAPSITSSGYTIDTRDSAAEGSGGAVTLTTTGTGAAGNLTVGIILTSGTAAAGDSGNGGGNAGNITLTAAGDTLSVAGQITARGGARGGGGITGQDGTVKLNAAAGAVTQTNGSNEMVAGKVIITALNSSSMLDTGNWVDLVSAKITGTGQNFTYRSGSDYGVGGGEGGVTGITTQGGSVDIGASDVAVSVIEGISTKGGSFSANGVRSFDSSTATVSTEGYIGYADGVYKNGGAISVVTTDNSGAITTGTLISSGDNTAAEATGGAIALDADGVLSIMTTTAQGKGTGVGGAVSLTGSTVNIGGTVDSSSTTAAGGAIAITGPVIVSGGNRTLTTGAGAGAGNISFSSTINSDGSARGLSLIAGTGDITLSGAVGGSSALGAINVESAKDVTASSTVNAASFTQQAGTGTTTLNGATTLSGNLAFTGNNLTVNAAAVVGGTTTISNAGLFATAANGDITSTGAFNQNGAGLNELAGDISTTNTNIAFATGVTLKGNVAMSTDTGIGNITFSSTVDSDTSARNLTLSAGTGNITLTGKAGNTAALGALTANSSGTTTFTDMVAAASVTTNAGGTTAINGGTVTTSGAQTYNDNVTLGDNTELIGSTVSALGTVAGGTHSLKVTGNAVFGDAAADTVTGLTTLEVTGTTAIHTDTITSADAQTYNGAVTVGTTTTLTATNDPVMFGSTVNSEASEANGLTVSAGSGAVTFTGAVGGGVNGALGALAVNSTDVTLFNGAVTAASVTTNTGGTVQLNGNVTTSGAQTYNDAVELLTDIALTTTNSAVQFAGTVNSEATETNNLSITAGTGDVTFGGATGGATDGRLGALTIVSAKDVTAVAITAESLTQQAGSGTTTLNGAVDANGAAGVSLTGTNLAVNAAVATTSTGGVTINESGTVSIAAAGDITSDGAVSITATGGISTAGDVTTTGDNITLASATTLTGDVAISTGTSAGVIAFGSTVDSDATQARSLRLTSGGAAGQNFVAAVGGTRALDLLRIESAGVVTQGGSAPIKAASLAIKAADDVTLNHAGNDADILAALLSGDASLSFVDADGLTIGTIDSASLQIIGISDGTGTSNITLTVGGLLTQQVAAPVDIAGNLTIDTTAYTAGDVDFTNTQAGGTKLDDTLVASDFTLVSNGNVTQKQDVQAAEDAYLRVGGNFSVTGGAFVQGDSTSNLFGGGSAARGPNEIRLVGVITLKMDGTTLLASTDNFTATADLSKNQSVTDAARLNVMVNSDAGGKTINLTGVDPAAKAINLSIANNKVGGYLKITTKGTYADSGASAVETGIAQDNALTLGAASFIVQQSSANDLTTEGRIVLNNAANSFTDTVALTTIGKEALISAATNLKLGNVNVDTLTVNIAAKNLSQAVDTAVLASKLAIVNAADVSLTNNNLVGTIAANVSGSLGFVNNQSLTIGTASAIDGITAAGPVSVITKTGNLTVSEAVATTSNALNAVVLNAGADTEAGTSTGGSIILSGDGTVTVGASGRAILYSGDVSDSTGLATLVGSGSGKFRYNSDETDSNFTAGLGTSGIYAVYREQPTLTVTADNASAVYGSTPTFTATVTGMQNGDTSGQAMSSVTITYSSAPSDLSTSGNLKVGEYTLNTPESAVSGLGYAFSYTDGVTADKNLTVNKKNLTAAYTGQDKTYDGGTSATVTGSSADIITDDVVTFSQTAAFAGKDYTGAATTINVSEIALGGDDSSNYNLTSTTATSSATINKKTVTLTGSKTYDGTTDMTGFVTIGTGVGSETLTYSGSTVNDKHVVTADKYIDAITLNNATDASGGLASNYQLPTLNAANAPVTITAKTLTPTVSNTGVTRVYDGTTDAPSGFTPTYSFSGLVSGDTDAALTHTGSIYDSKNVTAATKITVSGLAISGITGSNSSLASDYALDAASKDVAATITAKTVTLSATKVYNGNTDMTGKVTVATGISGESLTYSGATSNSKDVLAAYIDAITLGDGTGGIATNYQLPSLAGASAGVNTATVTAKAVSMTGSRVYDGTNAVDAGIFTLGTLVGTETLTLTGSGTLSSKNVVTNGAVTLGTLALGDGTNGGVASNYTFTGGTQTASVTAAPLSISTSDVAKTYNGTLAAAGTAVATSGTVFSGDSISGGTFAFTNANAGSNKTVTTSGVTVTDGNGGSNYSVTYVNNTTSTINKADITISSSDVTKTYDGGTTAVGTAVVTSGTLYTNASNGNALDNLSGGSFAFTDKNAGSGNKTVTVGSVTVNDGNSGNNYNVTYASNTTSTINRYAVSMTGSREYDGTTVVGSGIFTLGTLVGSETLGLSGSGLISGKDVNAYGSVTQDSLTLVDGSGLASNYILAGGTHTVSITPKTVTLSASKVYDRSTDLTGAVTLSTGVSGEVLTYTGATANDYNVLTSDKYIDAITLQNGTGGLASNYQLPTLNAANAPVAITRKVIAIDSIGAENKVYDGTTAATITGGSITSGLISGDDVALSTITGQFSDKNVGDSKLVYVSGGSLTGADAGNYQVTSLVTTSANITPRPLTISTDNVSRVYGDENPHYGSMTGNNLAVGDTLGVASVSSSATLSSNVGDYTLVPGSASFTSGSASNYTVTYQNGTLSVTARPITIAASAAAKEYGIVDPTLAYSVSGRGLVNGDTLNGALSRAVGENVGSYAINQGTLANGNYAITFNGANLSISPAALAITADAKSKAYSDADPALTYTASGFKNGDTAAVMSGALGRVAGEVVGNYAILQNTLASSNYTISYTGADLTINHNTPQVVETTNTALSNAQGSVDSSQQDQNGGVVAGSRDVPYIGVGAGSTTIVGLATNQLVSGTFTAGVTRSTLSTATSSVPVSFAVSPTGTTTLTTGTAPVNEQATASTSVSLFRQSSGGAMLLQGNFVVQEGAATISMTPAGGGSAGVIPPRTLSETSQVAFTLSQPDGSTVALLASISDGGFVTVTLPASASNIDAGKATLMAITVLKKEAGANLKSIKGVILKSK